MDNKTMTRNKKIINVIMYPIDDEELYIRSLGTTMLDIMEKQLGQDGLALVMEELQKQLNKEWLID